jgi:hypothetical protein
MYNKVLGAAFPLSDFSPLLDVPVVFAIDEAIANDG